MHVCALQEQSACEREEEDIHSAVSLASRAAHALRHAEDGDGVEAHDEVHLAGKGRTDGRNTAEALVQRKNRAEGIFNVFLLENLVGSFF